MTINTQDSLLLSQWGDHVAITTPSFSATKPMYEEMERLKKEAHSCASLRSVLKFLQKIKELEPSRRLLFYHENNPSDLFHKGGGNGRAEHLCPLDSQIIFVRDQILKNKSECVVL